MVRHALRGGAAGLAALQLFAFTPPALALPTGGQVVAGSASISQPNAQTMQINQGSQKAILNWQGFSIGGSEAVNFLQPGASSVALNRVVGSSPSDIFGALTANGQVFLVNPHGILFAPGASVNVGGLAASTLNIRNEDFLAGNYVFFRDGNAGSVVNQGTIHAPSGYAALIGPKVTNEGFISARMGSVALAAGDRVALDMIGDGLISVRIDQAALGAAVLNKGTIQADGGSVLLAARSADALLDTVVNNTGIIRATSLIERNGVIVLDGGSAGVVSNSGTLDVAGVDAGTTGGTVKVLGEYVGLFDNAAINASGDAGGGTVLIGGNFQGSGPEANASQTVVASSGSINADAVTSGNGGRVIVWSDSGTQFYGNVSARGGAQSGDGGFVEVSGKHGLRFAGTVDTRAPMGTTGTLVLDPDEARITHATNNTLDTNVTGSPSFVAVDATQDWTLSDFSINTALFNNSVTVTAKTITVDNTGVALGPSNAADGAPNALNNNNLALRATNATGNFFTYNGSTWSYTNNGGLTINSGDGAITGAVGLLTVDSIDGLGLVSGTTINVVTATRKIAAFAPGGVTVNNTAPGGTLTVTTVGATTGISTTNSPISLTEAGSILVSQPIDSGNAQTTIAFGQANAGATFSSIASIAAASTNINGGGGDDIFDFSAAPAITATLNGGAGTDTLKGNDAGSSWSITGERAGSVGGLTFSSMEALEGSATGDDTFTLAANVATFNGRINGNGGANDVLAATDGTNAWVVTGNNAGTLNTSTLFSNIRTLNGGAGNDTFTLAANVATFNGRINGNGGANDVLAATDGTNAWLLTGNNAGFLNTTTMFSNIETLTGGSGADTLSGVTGGSAWSITGANAVTVSNMSATSMEALVGGLGNDTFTLGALVSTFNGSIDGNGGANDVLAATDGTNAWVVTGNNAGTLNTTTTFSNIETLAGGSGADTLSGVTGGSLWSITGANAVTVSNMNATSMEALVGGAMGNDTFTLAAGVSTFNGSIDGNGGANDVLAATDGTNAWVVTGNNAGTLNTTTTFSNIETLTGGSGADTLSGVTGGSLWSITGANAVTVSNMNATSMEALVGGAMGNDTFTLAAGVSTFNGSINGNGGANDVLAATDATTNAWVVTGENTGTLNTTTRFSNIETLNGGLGDDRFTLAAGVATFNGSIDGNGVTNNVLAATDGTNAWVVTGENTGTLNASTRFSNIRTLDGGAGDDRFTLAAGVATFIGSINGNGGTNELAATDGTNAWLVTGENTGTLNAFTRFSNINTLNGGSGDDKFTLGPTVATFNGSINGNGGANELVATHGTNTWVVTGNNIGTLNGTTGFTNVQKLVGGIANDEFNVQAAGSIASIDGGLQLTADRLDLSGKVGAVSINTFARTATDVASFSNIESVIGNSGISGTTTTLSGAGFTLTGSNSGAADGIAYSGVGNLQGVAAPNTFTGAGGSVAGTIADGGMTTQLSGGITSGSTQTYNGAVTLTGNTTTASTGSGTITFAQVMTGGGFSLDMNTQGAGKLQNGASGLSSLTTDAGGTTELNAAISTSGHQTYNDAVMLTGNTTTASTGSGTITFAQAMTGGGFSLDMNTQGAGKLQNGASGLSSLTTDAGGTTELNATISTSGNQSYNDAVMLIGNTTTASTGSGTITFAQAMTGGGFSLGINTGGTGKIQNGASGLASLTTDAGGATELNGAISTSGNQSYNDAVSAGALSLTSTGGGSITATNAANDFTGLVTIVGGMTQITDANALTLKLDTGATTLTANAGGGAGELTVGGTTAGLIAISNRGVLRWTNLSAASAILSSLADATGGTLSVTGELVLNAANLGSGDPTSITARSAIFDIDSLVPNRVTLILDENLRLLVDQGVFRFSAGSQFPGGVSVLNPAQVRVCIADVCTTTTAERSGLEDAQRNAASSASTQARESFGTDSVTQQIDMGFSGDVGIAATMGHSVPLEGEIINTPKCVPEAKAGVECR